MLPSLYDDFPASGTAEEQKIWLKKKTCPVLEVSEVDQAWWGGVSVTRKCQGDKAVQQEEVGRRIW